MDDQNALLLLSAFLPPLAYSPRWGAGNWGVLSATQHWIRCLSDELRMSESRSSRGARPSVHDAFMIAGVRGGNTSMNYSNLLSRCAAAATEELGLARRIGGTSAVRRRLSRRQRQIIACRAGGAKIGDACTSTLAANPGQGRTRRKRDADGWSCDSAAGTRVAAADRPPESSGV